MYRKKREDKNNLLNVMFALGLANPWTSLYMDGTAIFDLPTCGGPFNPYNVTQTHSIFFKL